MPVIYEISDATHTYVGKTSHRWPRCRLSEHRRIARKGRQTPFYRWLQTDPDVEFKVLCKAEGETLDEYERRFIAHRRAGPKKCMNMNDGGEGDWSHLTPEQHRLRHARSVAAKKGIKHSEETKRKMRASQRGKKHKVTKKFGDAARRRWKDPELRARMSRTSFHGEDNG